jgi:hypothetical protein
LLAIEDYEGAALLQNESEPRWLNTDSVRGSTPVLDAVLPVVKVSTNATLEDAIQKHYDAELSSLLAGHDYDGAAALKRDMESGRLSTTIISAATSKQSKVAVDVLEYSAELASLLENDDYEGAAALKKAYEARCIASNLVAPQATTESAYAILQGDIEKQYESELGLLLARADYNGAAALKSEKDQGRLGIPVSSLVASKSPTHELSSRLHHVETFSEAALVDAEDAKMRDMLLAEDYVGAAALKREKEARCISNRFMAQQAVTVSTNVISQNAIAEHYEAALSSLLAGRDYDGAAALKRDMESGRLGIALISAATSKRDMDAEDGLLYISKLASLLEKGDYEGAAALKKLTRLAVLLPVLRLDD